MVSSGETLVRAAAVQGACVSERDKAGWVAGNTRASAPDGNTVGGTAQPLGAGSGIAKNKRHHWDPGWGPAPCPAVSHCPPPFCPAEELPAHWGPGAQGRGPTADHIHGCFICGSHALRARRPARKEQTFSTPFKEARSLLHRQCGSHRQGCGRKQMPWRNGLLGPASSSTGPMPPTAPGPEPRRFRWPLVPQDTAGIVRPAAGAKLQLRGQGPAVPGDKRAAFFPHEKGTCVPWGRGGRGRKGARGGPGRAVSTPPQGPLCALEWARWARKGKAARGPEQSLRLGPGWSLRPGLCS